MIMCQYFGGHFWLQLVLVLTDGDYGLNQDPYSSATGIKELPQKPLIFTIGIGHWEKPGNVKTLASRDGYYSFYTTWVSMTQNLTVGSAVGGKNSLPLDL